MGGLTAFYYLPDHNQSFENWVLLTLAIASGPLFVIGLIATEFSEFIQDENLLIDTIWVGFLIVMPCLLMFLYFKRSRVIFLVLGTISWYLVGWIITISATT